MSQKGYETPDFNIGRWLLWGLIAIAALAAIVLFFVWLGGDSDESASPATTLLPQSGEQTEWSIETSEVTPSPGFVTLKGDLPTGFPTETWKDGVMIARHTGDSFTWNLDVDPNVPAPVYEIDQVVAENLEQEAKCGELAGILEEWGQRVADAQGDAERIYTSAFAQHALNTMVEIGCPTP